MQGPELPLRMIVEYDIISETTVGGAIFVLVGWLWKGVDIRVPWVTEWGDTVPRFLMMARYTP
jgi:hypothetical protein